MKEISFVDINKNEIRMINQNSHHTKYIQNIV